MRKTSEFTKSRLHFFPEYATMKITKLKEESGMSKFFSVVGYVVTVIGTALGILYLINKFSAKDEVEEEVTAEDTDLSESEEETAEEPAPAAE